MRATSLRPASVSRTRPPVAVEQRDAGLALERGELLGDRRGRERECPRGGGDRPALRDLAQHAHAADVERAQVRGRRHRKRG